MGTIGVGRRPGMYSNHIDTHENRLKVLQLRIPYMCRVCESLADSRKGANACLRKQRTQRQEPTTRHTHTHRSRRRQPTKGATATTTTRSEQTRQGRRRRLETQPEEIEQTWTLTEKRERRTKHRTRTLDSGLVVCVCVCVCVCLRADGYSGNRLGIPVSSRANCGGRGRRSDDCEREHRHQRHSQPGTRYCPDWFGTDCRFSALALSHQQQQRQQQQQSSAETQLWRRHCTGCSRNDKRVRLDDHVGG